MMQFKGDPPLKKKKKRKHQELTDEIEPTNRDAGGDDGEEPWLPTPSAFSLLGPVFITLPSPTVTPKGMCLTINPTTSKVTAQPLPTSASLSPSDLVKLDIDPSALLEETTTSLTSTAGPTTTSQVFVLNPTPDSSIDPSDPNKPIQITLRSSEGKYLGCDEIGNVGCEREARGTQEIWEIQDSTDDDGAKKDWNKRGYIFFKGPYGNYLSLDEVAGGKLVFRCDTPSPLHLSDENCRFRVMIQRVNLGKRLEQAEALGGGRLVNNKGGKIKLGGMDYKSELGKSEKGGNIKTEEDEMIRKMQARGMGRLVGSAEDSQKLKKAKKEGRKNEEMLDRRMKVKSDRYC